MYLSKMELNIRRRETQRALSSPHIIHAAVEASFPTYTQKLRNLWRIDKLSGMQRLIVLSPQKPDFTHIIEQYGWPESEQKWDTKNYATFLDYIKQGQTWHFRLCANPTHSERVNGIRGKIYGHITAAQQRDWLCNNSEKNGFTISHFDIISREIKKFLREKNFVTINTVTFEGLLNIIDEETFKNTLIHGMGRAKAYGCGLITLAKTR